MARQASAEARQLGKFAEQKATELLIRKGYTIRELNWRPPHTKLEVDIVAQLDDTIIFVEVKAREFLGQDPLEAVDMKKIKNMVRAADIYLNAQEFTYFYRFDIITFEGGFTDFVIDHIEDAFLPPLSR